MGLLSEIKKDAKKSGQSKGKFIYFREGQKVRIRFLQDMDDGLQITFHDSFEKSVNVPCQSHFGRECPYCDRDDMRTRSQYVWSVWNYETNEVQLFMFPVNNCSPIPALVAMYENYGTLSDRDYVISVSGRQQNKTFSVVPMDKVKFRNAKAKPYSESQVLKMLDKAFPCEVEDEEDEEEDYTPVKKKASKKKPVKEPEPEEDDDYDADEVEDEDADEDDIDYESMSAKELYTLCKKRKIDAVPKKSQKYYIKLLEEYDEANEDWSNEDEEWEDDE